MLPATIRQIRSAVLNWYERNGRKLPWRESADPYRIWISEVMLQQTTVAAVIPYFERFTAQFPNVEALAAASADDVLRLWEGLGYYSRARNLHKAAQAIVLHHAGIFPREVAALQALPGIGRYTAGAISSFAFDEPSPIVEANTERLYARLLALQEDVRSSASQKTLWKLAELLVPAKRAGDFNQALMDIGARLCRPVDPECEQCPLRENCRTFELGQQQQIPVRKPNVRITPVTELAIAIVCRNHFLLRRRQLSERWAGMWDFVRFEMPESEVIQLPVADANKKKFTGRSKSLIATGETGIFKLSDSVREKTYAQSGLLCGPISDSMEFKYSVTRYRVRLLCYMCQVTRRNPQRESENLRWFSAEELTSLPLSATGRRIADWLQNKRGQVSFRRKET